MSSDQPTTPWRPSHAPSPGPGSIASRRSASMRAALQLAASPTRGRLGMASSIGRSCVQRRTTFRTQLHAISEGG